MCWVDAWITLCELLFHCSFAPSAFLDGNGKRVDCVLDQRKPTLQLAEEIEMLLGLDCLLNFLVSREDV